MAWPSLLVVLAVVALVAVTLAGRPQGPEPAPAAAAAGATLATTATTSAFPLEAPSAGVPDPLATTPDPAAVGPSPPSSPVPLGRMSGYRWPLDHARITADFGRRPGGIFIVNGEGFHDGLDIASFCGDRIEAAHDGVVLVAGRHVDRWVGWVGDVAPYHERLDAKDLWGTRAIMVVVDDGNGYRSVYIHLARAVVSAGEHVRAGQLLGYEGATGDATGCHLHYSIFSPFETATYETDPRLVERSKLPVGEIARIDPLGVLPPPEGASVTWGWGARD
jgi:murein DD-endopeptidase MepM/ murein hydrolase activator NlpD